MPYVTSAEVAAAVGGDSKLTQLLGTDNIDTFIVEASGEADARMAVIATVPLTDTKAILRIKGPLTDIIAYKLKVRRNVATDADQTLYEKAVQFFRDIAAGHIQLLDKSETSGPKFNSEVATFSRDELANF